MIQVILGRCAQLESVGRPSRVLPLTEVSRQKWLPQPAMQLWKCTVGELPSGNGTRFMYVFILEVLHIVAYAYYGFFSLMLVAVESLSTE